MLMAVSGSLMAMLPGSRLQTLVNHATRFLPPHNAHTCAIKHSEITSGDAYSLHQMPGIRKMQVSTTQDVQGARVVREIGRITASSCWHGRRAVSEEDYRSQALAALIAEAKEYEADAIVEVRYDTDDAQYLDLSGVPVKRTCISGIAVRIAHESRKNS
jgi:uncharacterized protein YbjQ (UPF0145 family)